MYCPHCGVSLPENSKFCRSCGQSQVAAAQEAAQDSQQTTGGTIGFSNNITDPAFAKYVQSTNRWAAIFSLILAVVAVVGFFLAGEMGSSDMENPQALFIGLAIGGMFVMIAMVQIGSRNRSKTWDGQVVDRKVEKKRRRRNAGKDDDYWEDYLLYTVLIRSDSGKIHEIRVENDDTIYNYYVVGDRVRHHAGLNSYEKYDKSKDTIVFCNACATINEISADYCSRCKCPLLK